MTQESVKRNFIQRIFGCCATKVPADPGAWRYQNGDLMLDLSRLPEISQPGGAIRLEGRGLPQRLLVYRGIDGNVQVFVNQCGHMGRRLDPTPSGAAVQCCSVGKSTYAPDGAVISGPATRALQRCDTMEENGKIHIVIPEQKGELP